MFTRNKAAHGLGRGRSHGWSRWGTKRTPITARRPSRPDARRTVGGRYWRPVTRAKSATRALSPAANGRTLRYDRSSHRQGGHHRAMAHGKPRYRSCSRAFFAAIRACSVAAVTCSVAVSGSLSGGVAGWARRCRQRRNVTMPMPIATTARIRLRNDAITPGMEAVDYHYAPDNRAGVAPDPVPVIALDKTAST